jgi:two-component system response regulator FlrC
MVEAGSFREDLYHRLAVFPVELPPLRERRADLLPLAQSILVRIAASVGKRGLELAESAKQAILSAEWRGNVRELSNALERAAIVTDGSQITAADLEPVGKRRTTAREADDGALGAQTLEDIERIAIEKALAAVDGNRRKAAERLGIGLRTLYEKLKRYGIE